MKTMIKFHVAEGDEKPTIDTEADGSFSLIVDTAGIDVKLINRSGTCLSVVESDGAFSVSKGIVVGIAQLIQVPAEQKSN
jgi:hypothetical protein